MASAAGDLVVRLTAQTRQFDQRMTRSRGVTGAFGKASAIAMAGVRMAAVAATAAIAAVGTAMLISARKGEEFNRKMRNSTAIMGDLSNVMRRDMKAAAIGMARVTSASAAVAASAFFFLASAGLDAKQSIAALPAVAQFAQAGNFDLATATDLATDAQAALGLTSKDASKNLKNLTRVTDVLIKANTIANASARQFSESLTNKTGVAFKQLGKDVEEAVAVLGVFADQGIKGAEAGTALGIVMRDLQTKSLNNAEGFRRAGIAVFDVNGEMNNLADIVADVERALGGMSDAQRKATLLQLGFSDKSVQFVQALIGSSEKIRDYEDQLRSAGGLTKEVADKQLTDIQKGMAAFGAATSKAGSALSEEFGPAIGGGIAVTGEFLGLITDLVAELGKLGVAAAGVDLEDNFFSRTLSGIRALTTALRAKFQIGEFDPETIAKRKAEEKAEKESVERREQFARKAAQNTFMFRQRLAPLQEELRKTVVKRQIDAQQQLANVIATQRGQDEAFAMAREANKTPQSFLIDPRTAPSEPIVDQKRPVGRVAAAEDRRQRVDEQLRLRRAAIQGGAAVDAAREAIRREESTRRTRESAVAMDRVTRPGRDQRQQADRVSVIEDRRQQADEQLRLRRAAIQGQAAVDSARAGIQREELALRASGQKAVEDGEGEPGDAQFAGAKVRGSAEAFSSVLAAISGRRNNTEARIEDNTGRGADATEELLEVIPNLFSQEPDIEIT